MPAVIETGRGPKPPTGGTRSGNTDLGNLPRSYARRLPYYALLIETGYQTNEFEPARDVLQWRTIRYGIDGAETTATLEVRALNAAKLQAAGAIGSEHLVTILDELTPERRVRIATALTSDTPVILFQGYPMTQRASWNARQQSISIECVSEADEILASGAAQQVFARWMRRNPNLPWTIDNHDAVAVTALPLVYNAGGRPNRSAEAVTVLVDGNEHSIYLHVEDDAPDAEWWNYADALRNLAWIHLVRPGAAISCAALFIDTDALADLAPATSGDDPFVRRMTQRPTDLNLRAMNMSEALSVWAKAAGLHWCSPLARATKGAPLAPMLRVWAQVRDSIEEGAAPSVNRAMHTPRVHDCGRMAPFADVADLSADALAGQNRGAFEAELERDSRAVQSPLYLGAAKRYEVTLLMRPGWRPLAAYNLDNLSQASDSAKESALQVWFEQLNPEDEFVDDTRPKIPLSPYHALHPLHRFVADVARLWVFPDSHRYVLAGLARTEWPQLYYEPWPVIVAGPPTNVWFHSTIGGGIVEAVNWAVRNRPMGNLIGRAHAGTGRAPIVRMTFNFQRDAAGLPLLPPDNEWLDISSACEIDTRRCAIRITAANPMFDPALRPSPDDLEGDIDDTMIEALIDGRCAIAVTCTIEGDERIRHAPTLTGSPRPRSRIIDVSERFRFENRRAQNSHLNGLPTDSDPAFETRDDRSELVRFGNREWSESAWDTVAGPIRVPWIDIGSDGWEVGDGLSGVAGMGIGWPEYPMIVAKLCGNDGDAGQSTTYQVTDLRQAPALA